MTAMYILISAMLLLRMCMISISKYTIVQMLIVKTKSFKFSRSLQNQTNYLMQSECAQIHIIFVIVRLIATNL